MPLQLRVIVLQVIFLIVILAVASEDYRFVMVDVGSYGSSNDIDVLNHTTFFKCLRNKNLDIPPLNNFLMILKKLMYVTFY